MQWYSFKGNPDANYALASVKKMENNPESWALLIGWINAYSQAEDPEVLKKILSNKVAAGGRNCNINQ